MDQLFSIINKLNAGQRAVIIGGFSLLFVFLMGLLVYSGMQKQDEKLNFLIASNLTKNQAMLAGSELEAAAIPFAVLGSGDRLSIKTNQANVNIAKIKLLISQNAANKHSGWEIFDKSSLGTTNFENKVKYTRALEGELARSLEALSGILSAKVKLGQPKETIFTQKKAEVTASAVLTLREGSNLSQKQIAGVKSFIASAIPNLKIKNIKLINQHGNLLEYTTQDIDNSKYLTQEKYKEKLEKDYEKKIVDILEPFIGINRVVAKVSVVLDFTKQDIEQEVFEPEGTIRSQQTTETTSASEEKGDSSGGAPGAQSNIQNPDDDGGGNKSKASKEEAKNIINYEITKKIIKQKNDAFALISRVTTAVTFDSTVLKDEKNKEEFLKNINSIVEETVSFKAKRGDKVSVRSFKFIGFGSLDGKENADGTPAVEVESDGGSLSSLAIKAMMQDFGEYIQYLIASILLLVFYRKFISNNEVEIIDSATAAAAAAGGGGAGAGGITGQGGALDPDLSDFSFEDSEFNSSVAQSRLKSKVKNQILNNMDGLDAESAAKYEILIDELDKQVQSNPEEIASMIEMLLTEGEAKFT